MMSPPGAASWETGGGEVPPVVRLTDLTEGASLPAQMSNIEGSRPCWICGGADLHLVKPSSLPATVVADDFKITDASYGRTAALYLCAACGFRQASHLPDVLGFYEALEDQE